ncbi:MAG: CDP-alcohol phosphatidyltransferase family protein [Methanosarcina sp.]|uniref:CDP-alcohol phosphatidyltransferase family protein n=1 Tax=Methanosarcina sp. TaxID=2213 RepID=UPI0026186399|nr:CDP-alcohol phosphatidyltransferase family protein [Methanosarcina sp.]MDD3245735.1 CDP-alcohol phosphatidyltransferase family protein [Methanosarcina sp.]MDD4249330.1 CDP-alcohol phosphatidyltransferase family protein [Methanosarcina sp.]
MNDSQHQQSHKTGMLTFARDLPNICSLAGLFCAVLSIYFAILGNFPIAIIGMIWAVFFDWGDGIIARRMKGRTDEYRAFGGQLDSLIDIVSFGICPAVFLLSYGEFSPWFLPGAFVIVATSAIRLSYFNVFGLVDDSTYMGLALDNNVIILAFVFLFNGLFGHTIFTVIIYTMFMVMAVFNLAPVRTPKFTGRWFYALGVYVTGLTAIYSWIL